MQVRIFTLQYNPAIARFDDEPLRNFLMDKDVRSITPQFFSRDGAPFVALQGLDYGSRRRKPTDQGRQRKEKQP